MESVLDVFGSNPFSVIALTDAINKYPFVPGRAGQIVDWNEEGISSTVVMIEEDNGTLNLINPTGRGGPGVSVVKDKRKARNLNVPHYQVDDAIFAEEVQNIREFGVGSQLQTVQNVVSKRLGNHVLLKHGPTLEYQRVGAVKGIILNGDGTTLYNLFTEFNVAQPAEVDFDLDNGAPASGALRKSCAGVVRTIADALGEATFIGVHAFCGNAFFDDLLSHKEVVASYVNTDMAKVLRDGYVYPNGDKVYGAFEFGGIVWENYRGSVGGSPFVNTDKAHIFPVGTPGLFRTVYAPADYVETVNTLGLPMYGKQWLMPDSKGVNLQTQMNPLSYCTRPGTLVQGKRT